VVEIPPGMYGTANDAYFKYLIDMARHALALDCIRVYTGC
jgi:hypothetical protein